MKKALVAPLNWGLGHATRCIPIIQSLLEHGLEVHIASDGKAKKVLEKEFPNAPMHALSSLNIVYGSHFLWSMLRQTPAFLQSIRTDRQIVKRLYEKHPFDYIISDNRYGVHHPKAINYFMTHQIQILSPFWIKPISHRLTKFYTRNFQKVWIPDFTGTNNLTGLMSAPKLSIPKKYLGVLSRFKPLRPSAKKYKMAFILSGPEPSRSNFESQIIDQLRHQNNLPQSILVRGLPGKESALYPQIENLEVVQYMDAQKLNQTLVDAEIVICRSGYTSVMDLISLGKKALLVPTPGQVEQEYLAERLATQQLFRYSKQTSFDLSLMDELIRFEPQMRYEHRPFDIAHFIPELASPKNDPNKQGRMVLAH